MGNLGNAMDIINSKSNLPAVCGRVCPHEKQCEGHCVLNKKGKGIRVGNWRDSSPTSTETWDSSERNCYPRLVERWR